MGKVINLMIDELSEGIPIRGKILFCIIGTAYARPENANICALDFSDDPQSELSTVIKNVDSRDRDRSNKFSEVLHKSQMINVLLIR